MIIYLRLVGIEPIVRLILFIFFASTWWLNLVYRAHQPKSEVNCLRLYGGNWRFMTDINHQLNVVGSLLALAASVYPTRSLKRLSSWLQGTILWPNSILIALLFWTAYWIDPEGTYSTYGHRWRPFYLCHAQHSLILVTAFCEALIRPHCLLWDSIQPSLMMWYIYCVWNIHIRRITGLWIYQIFNKVPDMALLELYLIPIVSAGVLLTKATCQTVERLGLAVRIIDWGQFGLDFKYYAKSIF